MSEPSSSSFGSTTSRPARFWIAVAVILATGFGIHARRIPAVFAKDGLLLPDPDDYMRLYRARLIVEGRDHLIRHIDDVNWPHGATLHWTAPMDYLLAAAVFVFGPLSRHADPAAAVGAWVPVAIGLIYAGLFMAFLERALGVRVAMLGGCLLIFSSGYQAAFRIGHCDHHALLELLFLLAMFPWLKRGADDSTGAPHCRRTAIVSGVAIGLAIWVSPLAMVPWAAILAGLVFARLHDSIERRPRWDALRILWGASSSLTVLAAAAIENGNAWMLPSIDRVSVLQAGIVLLGLLLPFGAGSRAMRIGRAAIFIVAIAALVPWMILRRDVALGAMARPEFHRWSSLVTELQPLVTRAGGQWTFRPLHEFLGFFPYVMPVFSVMFARAKKMDCGARVMVIALGIATTVLTILQLRWVDHWNSGAIPILAVGALELARRAGLARWPDAGAAVAFIGLAGLSYPIVRSEFSIAASEPEPAVRRSRIVANVINEIEAKLAKSEQRRGILCDQGDGPLLLYETRLPVVAAPYHRALDGLVAADRFFAETDVAAARQLLRDLKVHYVVVPMNAIEALWQFERVAWGGPRTADEPERKLDEHGELMLGLRFRSDDFMMTMAYRLTMVQNVEEIGLRPMAKIEEGAPTADGQSGLVYEVADGQSAR